jgi:hypothetical protein
MLYRYAWEASNITPADVSGLSLRESGQSGEVITPDRSGAIELLRCKKIADIAGDGVGGSVEGEVGAFNDVNFGVWHVAFV